MTYLLGERLKFDWKIVTITIISTLLFMADFYHRKFLFDQLGHWFRVVLYLVVPLVVILVIFRENPKEYGFGLGDWKAGLVITAIGVLFMAPVIYFFGSDNASMQKYYQPYVS